MSFKKGNMVEVLRNCGTPAGSWVCAEILDGNGQYYTVKCQERKVIQRVARRFMRPCPPLLDVKRWAPGEIIEVCCNGSWKLASVLQTVDKENYLVKLMGSSQEFEAHKCDMRARLVWQDEKWVLIGKGNQLLKENLEREDQAGNNVSLWSCIISSRTLKRASPCNWAFIEDPPKRIRVTLGNNGKCKRGNQTEEVLKVDDVAYPPQNCGVKYIHLSLTSGEPAYHNLPHENPNCFECSQSHDTDNTDSVASSIGSCSVFSVRDDELLCSDMDALSSDAESRCIRKKEGKKCSSSPDETLALEIHRLELCAYRKTLEAFHASGPFTWEKEEILTSLRISLCISNDEHLSELKRLGSRSMEQHIA